MDINITKRSIIITPAPKRDKKNGLKVFLWRGEEKPEYTDLPVMTTDLKKGQRKYTLPNGFNHTIKRISF